MLATLGSKECLFHLPMTFVEVPSDKDLVLYGEPAYPVYEIGALFAEAWTYAVPLGVHNGYAMDPDSLPESVLRAPRQLAINFHDGPLPRYAGLNAPVWALLHGERETLGLYLSGHPLDAFRDVLARYATCRTTELAAKADAPEVRVGGLIAGVRTLRTRKGDTMAIVRLEDQDGAAEVVLFPEAYRQHYPILNVDNPVLVRGKAEAGEDLSKILATELTQRSALTTVLESVRETRSEELARLRSQYG